MPGRRIAIDRGEPSVHLPIAGEPVGHLGVGRRQGVREQVGRAAEPQVQPDLLFRSEAGCEITRRDRFAVDRQITRRTQDQSGHPFGMILGVGDNDPGTQE